MQRPYEEIDGVVYHFGVEQISEEKQKMLLVNAISKYDLHTTPGIYEKLETYDSEKGTHVLVDPVAFRAAGRVQGYCKSSKCRGSSTHVQMSPAHCAPCGIYVLYNCTDCLARNLCLSRINSEGMPIDVVFADPRYIEDDEYTTDVKPSYYDAATQKHADHPMSLTFNKDGVVIGKSNDAYTYKYILPEKDDQSVMVLIFGKPKGKKYDTRYNGLMHSRHVCENIMRGKTCKTISGDYEENFHVCTVPPGVPGWIEKQEGSEKGMIVTRKYCYPCAVDYKISLNKKAAKSPRKSVSPENKMSKKLKELYVQIEALQKSIHDKEMHIMRLEGILDDHKLEY
jgi:hypothetical protein